MQHEEKLDNFYPQLVNANLQWCHPVFCFHGAIIMQLRRGISFKCCTIEFTLTSSSWPLIIRPSGSGATLRHMKWPSFFFSISQLCRAATPRWREFDYVVISLYMRERAVDWLDLLANELHGSVPINQWIIVVCLIAHEILIHDLYASMAHRHGKVIS